MRQLLDRPPQRKEMSPTETLAEAWVEAVRAEDNRRYREADRGRHTVEVEPSMPTRLPKGILRGSVDADVWMGEQAGDYEEVEVGGASSRTLDAHINRQNKLGRMGSQLRGTAADQIEGKWRPVGELDSSLVAGFATLEAQRQEALTAGQADPLASQIELMEAFEIL